MDIKLKDLTVEELKKLKAEIEAEILSRDCKKVAYQHDCINASKYHRQKPKHWAKLIHDVDLSKDNAFGFIGDFLIIDSTHLVPINSIIVECCCSDYTVYRIVGDYKKDKVFTGTNKDTVECLREVDKVLKC